MLIQQFVDLYAGPILFFVLGLTLIVSSLAYCTVAVADKDPKTKK